MNAAGYLLMLNKPELLDFDLIVTFTIFGIPGVLLGLSLALPPFYIVLVFQILVLHFAFVFFYLNILAPRFSASAVPNPRDSFQPSQRDPASMRASASARVSERVSARESATPRDSNAAQQPRGYIAKLVQS